MDLWIRKQDGEALMKVDTLWVAKNDLNNNYEIKVPAVPGSNVKLTVANYSTKQKALQILGEVQDLLITKLVRRPSGEIVELNHSCKVYVFPKDEPTNQ